MASLSVRLVGSLLVAFSAGAIAAAPVLAQSDQAALLELTKPGPTHQRLAALAGKWVVEGPSGQASQMVKGTAEARTILDGRFLDLEFSVGAGAEMTSARYTFGFDRRHEHYIVTFLDTYGTYFATGKGREEAGEIRMAGEDDDPMMKKMGLRKKFVIGLKVIDAKSFDLNVYWVDTRTPAENLMLGLAYRFRRPS
ncbi:MAG: DUF1579 family protein [Gemmatimonadales bacterium]|nr:DUF1579 family protein [Gemmatimonadales bacterium]